MKGGTGMYNLTIILLSTINSELINSNNYRIAKYILENMRALEDISITELAKECYVSNSSISRFCRDIGLRDYNELKSQIAKYQPAHQYAKNKFYYQSYQKEAPGQSFVEGVIENLQLLKRTINEKDIYKLVTDIANYSNVVAFGYMQSQSVAQNLQYDLQTCHKFIHTSMKYSDQNEYINNADSSNLIIILSESGTYFKRAFERKTLFRNTNDKPKIYLITCNSDIEIPYVDYYIRYESINDYASHPYSLAAITGMICTCYAERYLEAPEPI